MKTVTLKVPEEIKKSKIPSVLKRNQELIKIGKSKLYREAILYGSYKRILTLKEIQKIIK